jgi:hypothetical protein
MEQITKTRDDPPHIWTKEEIIECGLCEEDEPDFERDEVHDIISVCAQDEYDVDPDTLVDDTNDFEGENYSPLINEETVQDPVSEPAQNTVLEPAQEPVVDPVSHPALEPVQEPALEPVQEPALEPALEPAQEPALEPAQEPALEPAQEFEDQEEMTEGDTILPLNIEEKEENVELSNKQEPSHRAAIAKLALDKSIIEESAPDKDNDENEVLPLVNEEKEEIEKTPCSTTEATECTTTTSETAQVEQEPEPLSIVVPTLIDNENNEHNQDTELPAEDRVEVARCDSAIMDTPPVKKFKWKTWFQSLWFWS